MELVKKIHMKPYEERVQEYASGLYVLSSLGHVWDSPFIKELGVLAEKNPTQANRILHELHKLNPTLRDDAIELISGEKGTEMWIVLPDELEYNIDMSDFCIPVVERFLRSINDDVVWTYGLTFKNDHVARRNGYTKENVMVVVKYIVPQVAEFIEENFEKRTKLEVMSFE